jgi:hypothetical protein
LHIRRSVASRRTPTSSGSSTAINSSHSQTESPLACCVCAKRRQGYLWRPGLARPTRVDTTHGISSGCDIGEYDHPPRAFIHHIAVR